MPFACRPICVLLQNCFRQGNAQPRTWRRSQMSIADRLEWRIHEHVEQRTLVELQLQHVEGIECG